MFLITKDDITLIIAIILIVFVMIITIFAIIKYKMNKNMVDKNEKFYGEKAKNYEFLIVNLINGLGGNNNVLKLELIEEQNVIKAILKDYSLINYELLCKLEFIKIENNSDGVLLHCVNAKSFYDSLFGK